MSPPEPTEPGPTRSGKSGATRLGFFGLSQFQHQHVPFNHAIPTTQFQLNVPDYVTDRRLPHGSPHLPNAAAFGFHSAPYASAPGMVPGFVPGGDVGLTGGARAKPAAPAKPAAKRKAGVVQKEKSPTPAKKKPPAKKNNNARSVTPDEGASDGDSDGEFDDDDADDGKGGKTTDEVRRQRRMLSNRESARRSRRRKLEHVAVLDQAINGHKAENQQLIDRYREMEQRTESALRENALLKAEVERLTMALRDAAAGDKAVERVSSLQRIASGGALAAGGGPKVGDGTSSPAIGDDSPRGFVPFRSLQSYENLLSLQAQTGGR